MEEVKLKPVLPMDEANYRERLIFGREFDPRNYKGGICQFENMSYRQAVDLMARGLLSPQEKQNEAPTVQAFIDFVAAHDPDRWYLHGYVVSPYRADVRISVEGIRSLGSIADHDMVDFLRTFRKADTLFAEDGEPVYCWYD